jgi:hypothetical protein
MTLRALIFSTLSGMACVACKTHGADPDASVARSFTSAAAIPSAAPSAPTPARAGVPGDSSTTPPTASAIATTPVDDGVERFIVWGDAGAPSNESFWLEWRQPELKVRGHRVGALIYAGGGVYRFQETKGVGKGLKDCAEAFGLEEPRASNHFTFEVMGASAQRLDAPGEVVIEAPEAIEGVSLYENKVELEASIGSYLFVHDSADFIYCTAAHGGTTVGDYLFDLATGKTIEYPTKLDEIALRELAGQRPDAESKPCAAIADAGGTGDDPRFRGLSLGRAVPRWSKSKGLFLELGFSILRTHVQGFQECSLDVSGLPPTLKDVKVPHAFAELPRKLQGFTLRGWSLLPGDAATMTAVERAFLRKKKSK